MPTGDAVRSAIGRLAERLGPIRRAGGALEHIAARSRQESARLYMKLLNAARSPRLTPAALAEARGLAAALAPDGRSLQAERAARLEHDPSRMARDRCGAPAAAATVGGALPRIRRGDLSGSGSAGLSA